MRIGILANEVVMDAIGLMNEVLPEGIMVTNDDATVSFNDNVSESIGILEDHGLHLLQIGDNRFMVASAIAEQQETGDIEDKDVEDIEKIAEQDPAEAAREAMIAKLAKENDVKKVADTIAKITPHDEFVNELISDPDMKRKALALVMNKMTTMDANELSEIAGGLS
ncbi:MAG: hypothetical protein GF411_08830 [Candidatus Lokiarchaeota archaeon]|nr:hypothetical protein [Candidatus Lokiarchaeota archaeon]